MHPTRTLALVLASGWPVGCQHSEGHPQHHSTFPVTTPLRQDTELHDEYVAQLRAIHHIELRSLERGYLSEFLVDEGQQVEQGTKMFQLLPRIQDAELARAEAELDLATIEFQNTEMLAQKDIVAAPELAMARARLEKARAEQALARTHRDLTEVRAPFTGLMGRFEVRLGSLVEEGELLTTLSDNSTIWAYFNVPEAEYLSDRSGAGSRQVPVQLRMANGEIFEHAGQVETIEADFDSETGNIAFRAAFPNPEGLLRHGETGKVLVQRNHPDALIIPQAASFEILDRRYVFVVSEDGLVSQRRITIDAELPHLFVVGGGLEEGERILLEGLRKVQEGERIDFELRDPAEVVAHLEPHAE